MNENAFSNRLKIIQKSIGLYLVTLNDEELKYVQSVDFHLESREVPTVSITFPLSAVEVVIGQTEK